MTGKLKFTTLEVQPDVAMIVRMKALTRSMQVREFTDLVLRRGLEQLEKEAK